MYLPRRMRNASSPPRPDAAILQLARVHGASAIEIGFARRQSMVVNLKNGQKLRRQPERNGHEVLGLNSPGLRISQRQGAQ